MADNLVVVNTPEHRRIILVGFFRHLGDKSDSGFRGKKFQSCKVEIFEVPQKALEVVPGTFFRGRFDPLGTGWLFSFPSLATILP